MTPIQFQLISHSTQEGLSYQHLRFQITTEDGVIEPQDLRRLKLPNEVQWSQGIAIEGKGPIWLYSYLVHECYASSWVGCYDPRLGIVVVSSHTHAHFLSLRDDHYPDGFKDFVKKVWKEKEWITTCYSLRYSGQRAIKGIGFRVREEENGYKLIGTFQDKNGFGARFQIRLTDESLTTLTWAADQLNQSYRES
jgi:CRISPR-associated protein Csx3